MATLQACVEEIQDVVGALSGMRAAPDEVPEQLNVFPFAVCYPESGNYYIGPPNLMTGLHTIIVEVHVARKNLPTDYTGAMEFAKSVPNGIFDAIKDSTFTAFQTMTQIRYEFGALGWAEKPTIGWRFYLEGVKTQDVIT